MPSKFFAWTNATMAATCWARVTGSARIPAITPLPVPSVMLGTTFSPLLRSVVIDESRLVWVPLSEMVPAAVAE